MSLKELPRWPIVLLAVIWVVQALNLVTGYSLNPTFGLIPRSFDGLDGVLFMPLLHGSLSHAVANSVPLVVLGYLMAISARRVVMSASAIIIVLSGLGVWIFGNAAVHIGASGLIFGWFGFLVARGVFERRLMNLLIAGGVLLFYGSMVWGVLPGQDGISWESHLFGALAGAFAAYAMRRQV